MADLGAEVRKFNRMGLVLRMGFSPDQFSEINQGDRDEGDTNERVTNRMRKINKFYTNGSNYGSAPVIRDFRFSNDTNSAVPVGFDLQYIWKDFMVSAGVSYYIIGGTYKSYYSVLGDLSTRANNATVAAYDDINENYDRDNDYVPEAVGLFPTGGLEYQFTEYIESKRVDLPFKVGIHLTLEREYSLFMGGGINYHYGKTTRVIEATPTRGGPEFTPDIDEFSATQIGLFFFMNAEYRLTDRIGVMSGIQVNYGESKLVKDKRVTGSRTVNSLFHANDNNDEGGPEKGNQDDADVTTGPGFRRFTTLSFSGIQSHFGIVYYFTKFR